jgi:hypothetical protein
MLGESPPTRHAHPELRGSLAHHVGNHTVDANGSEKCRHESGEHPQEHREARSAHGVAYDIIHRHDIAERDNRVDRSDFPTEQGDQIRGIATRAYR